MRILFYHLHQFNCASSFDPPRLRRCSNSEYTNERSEQREKNHFRVHALCMNEEIYMH
jgi:hypothetical protein